MPCCRQVLSANCVVCVTGPFPPLLTISLPGGTAFIGLAGYTYYEGMRQVEINRADILRSKSMIGMRPRKAGIAGISIGLFWMGIYRLFG